MPCAPNLTAARCALAASSVVDAQACSCELCLCSPQFGSTKRKQFNAMFDELHTWVDKYDTAVVPSNARTLAWSSETL